MTREEKQREIDFLYQQLDKCGQILADWDEDKRPTYYEREYRKIMRQLAKLEPENWDYPYFKKDYTARNEKVANWCKVHKCSKCGGELKQSRSGSLRVVCQSCNSKFQLITKKRK